MSKKFYKNREVPGTYMSIPVKYCLGVAGKHGNTKHYNAEELTVKFLIKELKKLGCPESCWKGKTDGLNASFEIMDSAAKYIEWSKIEAAANKADVLANEAMAKHRNEFDKEFIILDFYGTKALCAWRNNNTCKIGMTFMCPVNLKAKRPYLIYKDNKIYLDDSGWVY